MTTIISLFCQVNFVGRMLTTAVTMAARTMGNVLTASDHSLAFVPRDSPAACARTKWTSACPALVTKAPPVWTGWTPSPACVPQVNTAIIISHFNILSTLLLLLARSLRIPVWPSAEHVPLIPLPQWRHLCHQGKQLQVYLCPGILGETVSHK